MALVSISRGEPRVITANLLGPVVINFNKRVAKQVVLDRQDYSHRFPVPLATDEKKPCEGAIDLRAGTGSPLSKAEQSISQRGCYPAARQLLYKHCPLSPR